MKRKHSNEEYREAVFSVENVECRDAGESGQAHISGVAIVFGQTTRISSYWDEFDEVIDRHALDNADMSDVALFVNHDSRMIPLARSRNGNGTLQLDIRDDGLHIDADLDINLNPSAAELYSALKRGDVNKMSFAFRIEKQEWSGLDKKGEVPLRTIKEISVLHEVSVVNYPAYEGTSADARSNDGQERPRCKALEEARAKWEEAHKGNLELEKAKALAMTI